MLDKKQTRKEIPEPVCESLLALRLADAGLGFALLSALGGFMRQPTIKIIEEDLFHFV